MSADYPVGEPFSSDAFEKLRSFVEDSLGSDECTNFEDFERDLHRCVTAFEAEVVGQKLRSYDIDTKEIEIGGDRFRRKGQFEKEYHGLTGSFTIMRTLYVPIGSHGKAVVPLDMRAGIVEGSWTPLLARVMARTVASTTPKEAAEIFEEFGGARPSASSLDRLPKALSEQWESMREDLERDLRQQETVPANAVAVGVSLDGVLIPMKTEKVADDEEGCVVQEPTEQRKKGGPLDYQEAGCGTVSFYDANGERIETTRYARGSEYKKKTLKSQLESELESIWAVCPYLTLVMLSDGAADHWDFFSGLAKRLGAESSRKVADLFHVLERVKKALDAFHGEGTSEACAVFETCRLWLRQEEDGADRVLRALRYRRDQSCGAIRKTIVTQIKYIENRKRDGLLSYKRLLDENLPVGSGVVEAACKTLATQRLKRSGMSWSHDGVQAILTLRSLIQSNRWVRGWKMISSLYRLDVNIAA